MELFYSSGLRLSELVGLDLTDVDLRDATVRVLGKGSKMRIVPVGRHAIEALTRWLKERTTLAERRIEAAVRRRARRAADSARGPAAHRWLGATPGTGTARAPAHVPSLVCDASARIEPGPARRAGTARPREHLARRRSTRTLISSTWPRSTTRPIRARAARPEENASSGRLHHGFPARHHHPLRPSPRRRRRSAATARSRSATPS